jgi:hypothetical protein
VQQARQEHEGQARYRGVVGYLRTFDASEVFAGGGRAVGIVSEDDSQATLRGASIDTASVGGDSRLLVRAGSVRNSIQCNDDAELLVLGGTVQSPIRALGRCHVWLRGGRVSGAVQAYNDAVIEIHGDDFRLDGVPIPGGLVAAPTGTLSGTLSSGDDFSFSISHNGAADVLTGSIVVVAPAAVPALGGAGVFACESQLSLAALLRTRQRRDPH